jgi:hypothetical protein
MSISRLSRRGAVALVVLLLLAPVATIAGLAWDMLFRVQPQSFDNTAEQFKYGSIGNMETQGMPYYVWYVLPRVFGEYLPGNGGYASFGFHWEPAHDVPVGFSRQTIGFPRVSFNCGLCHAASYRLSADDAPIVIPAGPGHTQNTQAYLEFLFSCASDPRFEPDVLLPEIKQNFELSAADELLYRHALIPATRKALLEQKAQNEWMKSRPKWGPGRVDPFNPMKFGRLGMAHDDTVGNADNMAIWSLATRKGQRLHWDGMQSSIREVLLTSAVGDGATLKSLELPALSRLESWLMNVKPPAYPGKIDPTLSSRGKAVFARVCNDCHGEGGHLTGKTVPITDIGTDPERHHLWTQDAARRYNAYADGYAFDFKAWVGTDGPNDGYSTGPLTGLWLRAPYLHNGSVPSLEDLLSEPYQGDLPEEVVSLPRTLGELSARELRTRTAELSKVEEHVRKARAAGRRPAMFFRGYDVLDQERVGFVSDRGNAAEETQPFVFDTRLKGNGHGGHTGARYGTTLPDDEKTALIEYLKTL